MDKVKRWKEKMNLCYNEVSPTELKHDLEASGFGVHHIGDRYKYVRNAINKSMKSENLL